MNKPSCDRWNERGTGEFSTSDIGSMLVCVCDVRAHACVCVWHCFELSGYWDGKGTFVCVWGGDRWESWFVLCCKSHFREVRRVVKRAVGHKGAPGPFVISVDCSEEGWGIHLSQGLSTGCSTLPFFCLLNRAQAQDTLKHIQRANRQIHQLCSDVHCIDKTLPGIFPLEANRITAYTHIQMSYINILHIKY